MTKESHFEWLEELNPQQRQAVTHGDGPLLVVAGAGSGKTRTLAYRVAYLVANGVDPERILLLTFTRRASEEMLKRASGILDRDGADTSRAWGGTFHATANRLLRMYGKAAALRSDFTVMDQSDAEDLLNVIRHDMNLHSREMRFPRKRTCMSIYSRCVNGTEDIHDVLERWFPWCAQWESKLKELFKAYVEYKQERNVLDYDDLLLYWEHLVADDSMAAKIGGRFDHILVDEYQDTNAVQASILRGMRRTCNNIMAVGDDAQSIYSFRAATIRNMFDFPDQFPGTTVVTLEQNYRSVTPILEATNRIIGQAKERYTKDLWSTRGQGERPKLVMAKDEAQQDEYVIERVLEHYEQGIPLKQQAVLVRAGHHSDSLEVELTRRNIPYHKYGGLRFLESAHVKDVVSLLRIIENPRDQIAWFRVLQLLDGIGPATASSITAHISESRFDPRALSTYPSKPSASLEQMDGLASMIEDLASDITLAPSAQVERVRKFYDPVLKKIYDNPTVRLRDVENLEQIAAGYNSRSSFLTDLQLDPPRSTSDLAGPPMRDEDWLVLSTIHSAKGCEWDVVYLIHAADGFLPSDMSTGTEEEIEEELRLTYVAMTRARDFLYVVWPQRYYHKWGRFTDKHSYAQPCRFLTKHVCETFDSVTLQGGKADNEASIADSDVRDIGAKLKARWE